MARSLPWYLPAASEGAMAPRSERRVMVVKAIVKVGEQEILGRGAPRGVVLWAEWLLWYERWC